MTVYERSILINEKVSRQMDESQLIFRWNSKISGKDDIEQDIYKALIDMDKAGIIDFNRLFNIMKSRKGLSIYDAIAYINKV